MEPKITAGHGRVSVELDPITAATNTDKALKVIGQQNLEYKTDVILNQKNKGQTTFSKQAASINQAKMFNLLKANIELTAEIAKKLDKMG